MDHFEMVEKLRQRANVTYEEAKNALEQCDWDILDALVLLESEGRVGNNTGAVPQEKFITKAEEEADVRSRKKENEKSIGRRICECAIRLIRKGLENTFTVRRGEEEIISVPVLVLVLLLVCVWPFTAIALIIGLFLGWRYRFSGPDIGKKINDIMDKAADTVDTKQE